VLDFLDIATDRYAAVEMLIEEIKIGQQSPLCASHGGHVRYPSRFRRHDSGHPGALTARRGSIPWPKIPLAPGIT